MKRIPYAAGTIQISAELFKEIMERLSSESIEEISDAARDAMGIFADKMGESCGNCSDIEAWKHDNARAVSDYQNALVLYAEASWWEKASKEREKVQ